MTLSTRVYKKLLHVPKGKITTYGELSKAVGLKNGQRAIGMIMKVRALRYRLKIAKDRKEITNTEFWDLYKKIGGNTVRNIAHLRTLIDEITTKRKV